MRPTFLCVCRGLFQKGSPEDEKFSLNEDDIIPCGGVPDRVIRTRKHTH